MGWVTLNREEEHFYLTVYSQSNKEEWNDL